MNELDRRRRSDVSELERRVLDAARKERPSPALSGRMAGALGMPPAMSLGETLGEAGGGGGVAPQTALNPPTDVNLLGASGNTLGQALTAATPAGMSWSALVPWLSGGLVLAALAGVVVMGSQDEPNAVGVNASTTPQAGQDNQPAEPVEGVDAKVGAKAERDPSLSEQRVAPHTLLERAPTQLELPQDAEPSGSPLAIERRAVERRSAAAPRAPELRDEIMAVDAARSAVRAGAGARGLTLLAEYERRYPKGSFRPEVAALRVEALVSLGRRAEARALARRIGQAQPGTPLADRVARIAGLDEP